MQVFLQQNLQHEQVQTVLNSIKEKYSNITLFAKDKEIDLNRDLLLISSPFLRSLLGSLPASVCPSASLILPSINSKSLIDLEKVLTKGSLDMMALERFDVEEIVEAGLLLGVNFTNFLQDFDKMSPERNAKSGDEFTESSDLESRPRVSSPERARNCVFVNQVLDGQSVNHVEPIVQEVQIKSEPDEYVEQAFQKSFLYRTIKEEKPLVENVEQYNNTYNETVKSGENGSNSILTAAFPAEETMDGEEGEIRDSPEHEERYLLTESPELSFNDELIIEETLNLETNPTEIEELLNATKHEIEKFLVVSKSSENSQSTVEPLTIEISPSKEPNTEDDQSSTSHKTAAAVESGLSKKDSGQCRFPCDMCAYETNVGLNIKKHMKSTHKCFYKFKCTRCVFSSSSEEKYKMHSCETSINDQKAQDMRPEAKFLCTMCSFKTHVPDSMKVHMKNKHKSFYVFKCNQCDFESTQYHKLSNHHCSSTYQSSSSAQDHGITFAQSTSLCMRCGRHHLAPCNHPADSVCDDPSCEKVGHVKSLHHPTTLTDYKTIQLRDSSIRLERPLSGKDKSISLNKSKGAAYSCNECAYKTNKASMIKMHAKKTHQSHYLFTCNICKFSTTDNNMFPSHRCKEEIIQCPQCDFTTKKSLLMKRHISTQHESQVYACGQCSYKCTTIDSFKKHQLLFCKDNINDIRQSSVSRESFSCDRCDYKGKDIHSLRNHKTTTHSNVPSRRTRSREDRSVTPQRRRDNFSPHDRSYSRRRTPSSRSMSPNRGPSTPFPPPDVLYLEPARESSRNHPTSRRRSEPKPRTKVLLCLRCGRRHAASCKHPEDSWCSQPGCGKTGHVVTLHHPRTGNDYRLIKSKVPGLIVNEPSEKSDSLRTKSKVSRKLTHRQNFQEL